MNKPTKCFLALIVIAFLFSACAAPAGGGTVPTTATPTVLPTDSPTATQTSTLVSMLPPTITPTASITPIPTIATFDAKTIVTATLASAAVCPQSDASLHIELPTDLYSTNLLTTMEEWSKFNSSLLDYLNAGGTVENLFKSYQSMNQLSDSVGGFLPTAMDITNDSVPEAIIANPYSDPEKPTPAIYIFSCNQGHYDLLFTWKMSGTIAGIQKVTIRDLNMDGIPELTVQTGLNDFEKASTLWIYEWDGKTFQSLLRVPYSSVGELVYRRGTLAQNLEYEDRIVVFGNYSFDFEDFDNNGTIEIITTWNDVRYSNGPSRNVKIIFAWNDQIFSLHRTIYSEPEYRFQAIQDGDDASEFGEFEKAISLYQDAIFSEKLLQYKQDLYNHLAAYAYYRMVALRVHLGEMDAATVQYNTLQQKFPTGDPGHPYVEMAIAFWDAYQSSTNMTTACAAAIEYAAEHPEILVPLGSDYHGAQSHIYVPADVCPFR